MTPPWRRKSTARFSRQWALSAGLHAAPIASLAADYKDIRTDKLDIHADRKDLKSDIATALKGKH
jgi:hypothetical protein